MIRTSAVEAATRIAGRRQRTRARVAAAPRGHENFSVKRAAIQGYLAAGGDGARDVLIKQLPERDHFILDIQRVDVRQVPQAQGGLHLVNRREKDLPVHDLNPGRDCGGKGGGKGDGRQGGGGGGDAKTAATATAAEHEAP